MDKILTKQAGIEYLHEVTSVFQPFQLVSTQHLELWNCSELFQLRIFPKLFHVVPGVLKWPHQVSPVAF